MTVTVERNFIINGDRYLYDGQLTGEEGWCQVDTENDAWYYGTWANPFERKIVSYCEGDLTRIHCTTDEEFQEHIKSIANYDSFTGIDTGWPEREYSRKLTQRWAELNLSHYLHKNHD